jgi:uncharacterized membrane protein
MFDIGKFKSAGKLRLKGSVKDCLPVSVIILVLMASTSVRKSSGGVPGNVTASDISSWNFSMVYGLEISADPFASALSIINFVVTGILSLVVAKFFLKFSKMPLTEKPTLRMFIDGFSDWAKGLLGFCWMTLWIVLWSFLLFIPGIIKIFAYSQTFYILAEYPKMGVRKAMKISVAITRGYKWDLFLLGLSFVGWFFLSVLTFGLLLVWVYPYVQLTFTYAYRYLKERALALGQLHPSDFE